MLKRGNVVCMCSLEIKKSHNLVFCYVKCCAGQRLSFTTKNWSPFVQWEHLTKQQKMFLSSLLSFLCTTLCLYPGTATTVFVPLKSFPISAWLPLSNQILIFLTAVLITVLDHYKQSLCVKANSPWLAPWLSIYRCLTHTLPPYLLELFNTQLLQLTLLWKKYSSISHRAEDTYTPGLAGNAVSTIGTKSQQFFFHPH